MLSYYINGMNIDTASTGEQFIKISEMARLHSISRQTLIFYDKENLFKPHHTDENGFRIYSSLQIPRLREICLLKSLGVPLEEIRDHIENRNVANTLVLLNQQKKLIEEKIESLVKALESVKQRISAFEEVPAILDRLEKPFLQDLPERTAIWYPFGSPLDRNQLHLTLMKTRRHLAHYGIMPVAGFGTAYMPESIEHKRPLERAGSCSFMPNLTLPDPHLIHFPAGTYACMYKYGMPYETAGIERLLGWIEGEDLSVSGTAVDVCILDTTFYTTEQQVDLGLLQIPVAVR